MVFESEWGVLIGCIIVLVLLWGKFLLQFWWRQRQKQKKLAKLEKLANEIKEAPQQQVMYQPGSIEAQMAVINEAYSAEGPAVTIIRLKE